MKFITVVLLLSFSYLTFAAEDEFNFDVDELERTVAQEEKEDFSFSDEDLNNDESEFNFSDDDLKDSKIESDLSFTPEKETPKLNPDTRIISTRKGKYIYHPNQEKGLYKINKKSEYLYKYKQSPAKGFINVKAGNVNLANFEAEDGTKFSDLYDSDSITALFFEYDWEPFKKHRSLSVKVGGGLSYARGSGRFVGNTNVQDSPLERFNFMLFNSTAGLTYKFKNLSNQLFIPFVTGGLDYNLATEFKSGFSAFKYQGILGAHAGGGLSINISWLERQASLDLDRQYGINNTYLTIEARNIISFDEDEDIGGLIIIAGLSFEY